MSRTILTFVDALSEDLAPFAAALVDFLQSCQQAGAVVADSTFSGGFPNLSRQWSKQVEIIHRGLGQGFCTPSHGSHLLESYMVCGVMLKPGLGFLRGINVSHAFGPKQITSAPGRRNQQDSRRFAFSLHRGTLRQQNLPQITDPFAHLWGVWPVQNVALGLAAFGIFQRFVRRLVPQMPVQTDDMHLDNGLKL